MEHEEKRNHSEHEEKREDALEHKEEKEHKVEHEEKKHHVEHKQKDNDVAEKLRSNPWILSTFVLGVLVALLLITSFTGVTGKTISEDKAGELVSGFVESQVGSEVEVVEVSLDGGLYEVLISYQGQNVPVYVTADGKNLVQGVIPLSDLSLNSGDQEVGSEIPKADKPKVELFIWSYCPYGVQAQGPLAEVASLLGDYVDFETILYYDGHGAYETQQNKIQSCIQESYPKKYWDYASSFVEDIYPKCGSSKDIDCDKAEAIKLMNSLGIDSSKVMSCVDSKGQDLIDTSSQYSKSLGVTGSPTLMINGVKADVARNAEAYKDAVCSSFTNPPEECGEVLENINPSTPSSASC